MALPKHEDEHAKGDDGRADIRRIYRPCINNEVKDLIKRYMRKTNFIYSQVEIENLTLKQVLGKVNQYVFSQKDYN